MSLDTTPFASLVSELDESMLKTGMSLADTPTSAGSSPDNSSSGSQTPSSQFVFSDTESFLEEAAYASARTTEMVLVDAENRHYVFEEVAFEPSDNEIPTSVNLFRVKKEKKSKKPKSGMMGSYLWSTPSATPKSDIINTSVTSIASAESQDSELESKSKKSKRGFFPKIKVPRALRK
jgi:hypothetical protein